MASPNPMPTDDSPLDLLDFGQISPVYDDSPLDLD